MGYLVIHCESCGGEWQVYKRHIKDPSSAICPHCGKRMYRTTYDTLEKKLEAMEKVNLAIAQDAAEAHLPRFQVDYIDNSVYKIAGQVKIIEPVLDILQDMNNKKKGDLFT